MLDDFASLDEAHRGVEPAVIRRRAGSKVNEDRVGISMDHLNRDTAPGMHPGAARQRPMIAAFEHRARRQMREIWRVAALRELLEIVECDAGDHIRRWSGIRFEQRIEVRRGETDAVMDLGWAQVTEAGAVLCASLGEALGELDALRKAVTGGDGFADGFPSAALAALLRTKLALPLLSKADWVKISAVGRI